MDVLCETLVCVVWQLHRRPPLISRHTHSDDLVKKHKYHGFPVLHGAELVGYVTRDKLMMAIEGLFSEDPMPSPERQCSFSDQPPGEEGDFEVLSGLLEAATMQLRKELPQELVVNMFQKLASRSYLFSFQWI